MYRAVTLYALEHGAIRSGIVDEEAVVKLLDQIICIDFPLQSRTRRQRHLRQRRPAPRARSARSRCANCVSARQRRSPRCARKLVAMQQEMGRRRGVVMDGRDIGTVVFPDAELKLFMTADPAVRADRRYEELTGQGQ